RHEQRQRHGDVRDQENGEKGRGHPRIVGGGPVQPGSTASSATQSESSQRSLISKPAASRARRVAGSRSTKIPDATSVPPRTSSPARSGAISIKTPAIMVVNTASNGHDTPRV